MRKLFGKDYIRVRFFLTGREYTYYCPGAKVGSLVEVPPNVLVDWPQRVRVTSIGRRYLGPVREARLIDA